MSFNPLVSIIINCYNSEKFLKYTIESVLLQKYKNFEIIFWDNKSTDNSYTIAKSFEDNRIKLFKSSEHQKLYAARNCALNEAKGDFIAFVDSDDIWLKDKLFIQMEDFKNEEIGFSFTNIIIKNENSLNFIKNTKYLSGGYIFKKLLKKYYVPFSSLILRKSILKKFNLKFDDNFDYLGDIDLILRMSYYCKASTIQKPLIIYRIHNSNLSLINKDQQTDEYSYLLKKLRNIDIFRSNQNFKFFQYKVFYIKILNEKLKGNFKQSLKYLFQYKTGISKLKLILIIFTPIFILKKIKLYL